MKLTRDSALWTVTLILAVLLFLVANLDMLVDVGFSPRALAWVKLITGVVGVVAAFMKASPLPLNKENPMAINPTTAANTLGPLGGIKAAWLLPILLAAGVGAAFLTMPSCAGFKVQTGVSPVADIANAGAKIEDTAHTILTAAATYQKEGAITRDNLDTVALAVNKIGHVGKDLKSALDAYNAAKAAAKDLTLSRTAIDASLSAIGQALADIGNAIPPGTLQRIDQAALAIVDVVMQVKGTVGL